MAGFIGKYRIDITITKTGLIKAEVLSKIIREKKVFMCMLKLIPSTIVAYHFLVLLAECLAFKTKTLS